MVTGAADELETSVEFAAALLEVMSLSLLGVGVTLDCEVLESASVELALLVKARGTATMVVDVGVAVSLLASVEVAFVLATGTELDVVNVVLDGVLDSVLDENRKSKNEGDVEVEPLDEDVLTVDADAVLKLVVATTVVVPFAEAASVSKIVSSTVSVAVAVSTAAAGGGGGGDIEEESDSVDLDSSKLEVCAEF